MGRKQLSEDERLAQMHIGVPYKWKYDLGLRQFLKEKIKHYTSMNTIKLLAFAIFISSCSKDDEPTKISCICDATVETPYGNYYKVKGAESDCNGKFYNIKFFNEGDKVVGWSNCIEK